MRDIQHAYAALDKAAYKSKQGVNLPGRQDRRRLIKDQYPGLQRERPGDLHHTEERSPMAETATITRDDVIEALKDVFDPEIPVNVVDLGLVYDVGVDKGDVDVKMTLTFAGCGMGPYIAQQAEWRIAEIEGVEDVNVELVYDPPWTPDLITEDGKKLLGLD